jgi:hypothetical protein
MKKIVYIGALALLTSVFTGCDQNNATSTGEASGSIAATSNTTTEDNTATDASTEAANEAAAQITFEENEYDFGRVVAGEVVKHTFKFTNSGSVPLLIQNASASCGCTVPRWPKEPIAPGSTGEITVEFNSQGRVGSQNKTVTVLANTQPNTNVVTLKGEVLDASNGPVAQ